MSQIVAGNFPNKAQADNAIQALLSAGIGAEHIRTFREEDHGAPNEGEPARRAGVLVAVGAPLALERAFAADVLKQRGARHVEEIQGIWEGGSWVDFDPAPEKHLGE